MVEGRDAHIAIMVAAAHGRGVRLSADEVAALACDDAIETAAMNGLDEVDWPEHEKGGSPKWAKIKPRREGRVCKNFAVGDVSTTHR